MSKLIIDNQSKISYQSALTVVGKVMQMGRISDGGFCYVTIFNLRDCVVYASMNKCSDRFLILNR